VGGKATIDLYDAGQFLRTVRYCAEAVWVDGFYEQPVWVCCTPTE